MKSKVLGKNTSLPPLLSSTGTRLPEGWWKERTVRTQSGVPDCGCHSSHKQYGSLINYCRLETALRECYAREISKSYFGNSFSVPFAIAYQNTASSTEQYTSWFLFLIRALWDQRTFLLRSFHATSSPESVLHAFLSYVLCANTVNYRFCMCVRENLWHSSSFCALHCPLLLLPLNLCIPFSTFLP